MVSEDGPIQVTIEGEGSTFLERVQNCANREYSVISALKELITDKGLCHEEWHENDGPILYRGRVYVPPNSQLRLNIVNVLHDSLITIPTTFLSTNSTFGKYSTDSTLMEFLPMQTNASSTLFK